MPNLDRWMTTPIFFSNAVDAQSCLSAVRKHYDEETVSLSPDSTPTALIFQGFTYVKDVFFREDDNAEDEPSLNEIIANFPIINQHYAYKYIFSEKSEFFGAGIVYIGADGEEIGATILNDLYDCVGEFQALSA